MTEMHKEDKETKKQDDNFVDNLSNWLEKAAKFSENVPESVRKLMDQAKQMGMSVVAFKETFSKYIKQDSGDFKFDAEKNSKSANEKNDTEKK